MTVIIAGEFWVIAGLVYFWLGVFTIVTEAIIAPSGRNGKPERKGKLWLPILSFAISGAFFGYAIGSVWWLIGFVVGQVIFCIIMLVCAAQPVSLNSYPTTTSTTSTPPSSSSSGSSFGGFSGGSSGGGGAGRSW